MNLPLLIIALIWLIGTCFRIYKQARFFQIEEYMGGRYLHWTFARRERWLLRRPIMAWIGAGVIGFVLSEAPGDVLLMIIGIISAIIAVWPPDEGEIKKAFRSTPRAKRMLGAAFVVATFDLVLYLFILSKLPIPDMGAIRFGVYGFVGLFLFLSAPFILIAGNLLMTPVEAFFRRQFINRARGVLDDVQPKVIGITGSYGKTSTKTYLANILNGRYKTYPTPKSYNTLMGVSMAINNDLAGDHSVEYFICEMGAYIPGEIERIADLTQPSIGIVIEIGPQHLERFGTLENTATAKYELIKALPADGLGVFNWDNPYVRAMYEKGYPQNRIAVSREVDPANIPAGGPRFIASDVSEGLDGLRFTVTDTQTGSQEIFETPLLGQHNVTNLLLATAVAIHEGMSLKDVARRVRSLQPAESRLVRRVSAEGITIINDAYSANPAGVVSALQVLSLHQTGRRLLITPGMVELGSVMEAENRKLGEIAADHATDVILVGQQQTAPIKTGLQAAGFPADHLQVVDTLAESVAWYQANLKAGDTVLFLNDLPDTYTS
ncbi:MAG: UDP-N-acetylmuramoyl-tripeptide--D-alanyl-D-alanine ligase [Chloroflexota bacterium]